MNSNESITDEPFTFEDIVQYINENIIGLALFVLVFFIIYFVDYISRLNAIMFAMPSPVPGLQISTNNIAMPKPFKNKKSKKH